MPCFNHISEQLSTLKKRCDYTPMRQPFNNGTKNYKTWTSCGLQLVNMIPLLLLPFYMYQSNSYSKKKSIFFQSNYSKWTDQTLWIKFVLLQQLLSPRADTHTMAVVYLFVEIGIKMKMKFLLKHVKWEKGKQLIVWDLSNKSSDN